MIKFKQFHVTEKYKKKAYEETCDCDCGESPCVTCGKDHHEVEESSCGKKHRKEAVSMSSIKKEIASLKKDKSVSEKEAIQMLKTIYPKNKNDIDKLWKEALDPVNKKALMKKFKNRKDKDIDNDGDVDKSDEYLHRRRKAISRALETEEGDLKDACWDGYKAVGMKKKNGKMVPNCVPEEVELEEGKMKIYLFSTKPEAEKKAKELGGKVVQNKRDGRWAAVIKGVKEEYEKQDWVVAESYDKPANTLAGRYKQAVDRAVSIIMGAIKNGVKPEKAYAEWERKSVFGPVLKDQVKSRVLRRNTKEEVELSVGKVNERELTSGEEKKKEEIVKSMKKKMDSFEDRYGDRAKSVMYATATKMAKKS